MTSETILILQSIATQIVNASTTFTDCAVGAFLDINGDDRVVYLRDQGTNTELVRYGYNDSVIPQMYIRFRGREEWAINPNEPQLQSDKRRQLEIIPCRLVALFQGESMFEVADKIKHDILSVNVNPIENVDTVRIDQERCYIDYINGWDEENNGELRSFLGTYNSIALDFNVNYWRSGGCRQFEQIFPNIN